MSDATTAHPSLDQLTAFAHGRLGEAELAELASHLAGCEACRAQVEATGDDTLIGLLRAADTEHDSVAKFDPSQAETLAPAADPTAAPQIPAELAVHGRYRVQELLGVGGMGAVYRAEHLLMERPVALKLISPGLISNPAMVERFRREVKTAARLKHPNIVMAYDAEQAGASHFLVMEYVEGKSLARIVSEQGPLPIQQACDAIRQAALGLQHAHERGMVHRDIKPQNLMLTPDGQVKILDFGLARFAMETAPTGALLAALPTEAPPLASENRSGGESITQVGTVMGTPDYIAPEQATDAHTADIRADIYSLGCTLYDLLAGHAPFPDGTVVSKVMAHIEQSPKPLAELREDIPRDLVRVVERMLVKDPAKRFQTPVEVAEALAPFSAPSPIKRRRWPFAVAAAVLISICGYLAPTVYRIVRDQGTLVIEVDDSQFDIVLKSAGLEVLDRATNRKYTVNAGRNHVRAGGNYELQVSDADGLLLFTHDFKITRNGRTAVNITLDARMLQAREQDRRNGTVDFEVFAKDGHTALRLRSLTLVFMGTDDRNVPQAVGLLSVPQPGMTGELGLTSYNQFVIQSQRIANGVNSIVTGLGPMKLIENGTRLTVGGQTLDIYGPEQTIFVRPDGKVQKGDKSTPPDYENLQGTWRGVAGTTRGQRIPDEMVRQVIVKFDGDIMDVTQPGQHHKGEFSLDPSKSPKRIIVIADASEKFIGMRGVYLLDGDTLRIGMGKPEEGPITEFGGTAGMDLTLRREDNNAKIEAATKATTEWLKYVDAGDFARAWDHTAHFLQQLVSKKDYVALSEPVHKRLGRLQERTIATKQYATALPGTPVGQYVVILCRSRFEHWPNVAETLVPMLESDGQWRISQSLINFETVPPDKRELDVAIRAGRGQLTKQELEALGRDEQSNIPVLLSDNSTKSILYIFASLPQGAYEELLKAGYLKWKFTSLDGGRRAIMREAYQRSLNEAKKLGVQVPPTQSLEAFEKSDVGCALVNVIGLPRSVVSWYILLPAHMQPNWVQLVGPKIEDKQALVEDHFRDLSSVRIKPYSQSIEVLAKAAGLDRGKNDKELLLGSWRGVAAEVGGQSMPQEMIDMVKPTLTFTPEKMIGKPQGTIPKPFLEMAISKGFLPREVAVIVEQGVEGIYHLDSTKSPKQIDFTILGEVRKTALGVYHLDGDTLKLCMAIDPGKVADRPTGFTSKPGGTHAVLTLRRLRDSEPSGNPKSAREQTDQSKIQGVWKPGTGSVQGQKLPEAIFQAVGPTITFADGKVNWKANPSPEARNIFGGLLAKFSLDGVFHLDPTKSPKTIDLTILGAGAKTPLGTPAPRALLGIYKFSGDNLELCIAIDPDHAEERPAKFDSEPGKSIVHVILKRQLEKPLSDGRK